MKVAMERFGVLIPEKRTSLSGPLSCVQKCLHGQRINIPSISIDSHCLRRTITLSPFAVDHTAFLPYTMNSTTCEMMRVGQHMCRQRGHNFFACIR